MIYIRIIALLFSISATIITVAGCCNVRRRRPIPSHKIKDTIKKNDSISKQKTELKPESMRYYAGKKLTQKQIKLTKIYENLEEAEKMLDRKNAEGALRTVKRIQNSVQNNPYLDMQTWYLSAKIYNKMGKTSRRKRAMRKMISAMKKMQKNPSYYKAYKDGMMSKDLVNRVIKKEKGKYDF